LIGSAHEPAERFFVGMLDADACGIKCAEIELGVVVAGLRRLHIAVRHVAIESGIGCGGEGACQESSAAEDCPKCGSLHDALNQPRGKKFSAENAEVMEPARLTNPKRLYIVDFRFQRRTTRHGVNPAIGATLPRTPRLFCESGHVAIIKTM